ncbi:hypothetical protein BKD30_00920 [Tersicoccus phoenicis]|uniref:DNA methylase N-4/N-6 domain-containing protein n=1 Tax=Tersicoccus phoenicis TaxID=554083 RepID=A0A1R1LP94_9MICC|nr:hypothetical protein BKD30_00920 [Tersicoccus phoenicis]
MGCLTLSWVGKDRALIGTPDGGYAWVPRDDPRVTEVRLLQERSSVGEVGDTSAPTTDNQLITGDSYDALHALTRIPEYASEYRGRVKLVYIDPPFNTGQAFDHYDDALEHSVWLTMMRDRLLLIRDLLAPDGSVWVHLDDAEMAYCPVLMDEVFGRANFIATVIWEKVYSPKNSARHLSVDHDYVLVYARDAEVWRPQPLPRTPEMDAAYRNPDEDVRGVWKPGDLVANKSYRLGVYPVTTPSGRVIPGPPPGRYWRVSEGRLRELDQDGRIWWGERSDNIPALKRFLSEVRGRVPQTLWPYAEVGHNQSGKNEIQALFKGMIPFSTPKPERLLQRVIHIATNPGDIVLDCFGGSGTTAAVAHKMGRRWVTVELSPETVETFTRPRLEKVVNGADPGGVTEATAWSGGGGFRHVEVGPSLYDIADGHVFLAAWATGSALSRAIAAQLGFTTECDPPFAGARGRERLAVIDGVVDDAVVRAVVARLGDGERTVVVGKAATPEAGVLLEELSPGSRLRKAPRDLLHRGVVR